MGQLAQPQHNGSQLTANINYEVDHRSVEFSEELPSSFAYAVQKIIQEIQGFYNGGKELAMERFLMGHLDLRFNKFNVIDEVAFHKEKSIFEVLKSNPSRFQNLPWEELKTKESFYELVKIIERQYYLQTMMQGMFKSSEDINESILNLQTDFLTLRKRLHYHEGEILRLQGQLLKRMFYRYYQNVFKLYANSSYKQQLLQFHSDIGKLLCQIIEKNQFEREELFELFYSMVFIYKEANGVSSKLQYLRKKYQKFCLEKKYVINVSQKKLKVYNTAAMMYVNELYMNSLKEAEDPEIVYGNESLIPIRTFPIQRVKQRQRYK